MLELLCPAVVLDLNLLALDKTQSGLGEKREFAAVSTFTAVSFEVTCTYALKISCFSLYFLLLVARSAR